MINTHTILSEALFLISKKENFLQNDVACRTADGRVAALWETDCAKFSLLGAIDRVHQKHTFVLCRLKLSKGEETRKKVEMSRAVSLAYKTILNIVKPGSDDFLDVERFSSASNHDHVCSVLRQAIANSI